MQTVCSPCASCCEVHWVYETVYETIHRANRIRAMKQDARPASGAASTTPPAGTRIAEYLLFWLGLSLFGLCCLAWSLTATVLYRLLPRRRGGRLGQFAIMAGFRGYLTAMEAIGVFRCDLRALDALRNAGALVIA